MPDPLQNAAFLQQLFRPVSEVGAGFGEANVRAEGLGYQDRLRQLKVLQDQEEARRDFGYKEALTNLQIAGQERISREQTARMIESQNLQTDRALRQQKEMTDRALELATAKELAEAKKQYRLLAGPKAKEAATFGATAQEQLDGINLELAKLNDAKAKSAAAVYLRSQQAMDEEMERITTITDKDEAVLVANAIGSITSKDARTKLAKLKGATDARSILTFLAPLFPGAAAEFTAGYEAAKDAVILNRSKGSKIATLQRDLQYKAALLKDPSVFNYIALGLDREKEAMTEDTKKAPATLDDLFAVPAGEAPPLTPGAPVPASGAPPPLSFLPFEPTPAAGGANRNTRNSDFVTDALMVQPFLGAVNRLTPANYRQNPMSRDPAAALFEYRVPEETRMADLVTRLGFLADRSSPRGAAIRKQLYDLTSPAAYINSRPNYFAGTR